MPGFKKDIVNRNTLSGVTAGSPSAIQISPENGLVHALHFLYAENGVKATEAVMAAAHSELELQFGGRLFSRYRVADILKMNNFYGYGFVPGVLSLHFSQDFRQSSLEAEKTALVVGAHRTCETRLFINAGRISPTLSQKLTVEGIGDRGRAIVSNNPADGANRIIKHEVESLTLTSTGPTPTRIVFDTTREHIRSFNFTSASITGIVIKINGVDAVEFQDINELNDRLTGSRAGAVPQADTWHLNFELLAGTLNGVLQPQFQRTNARGEAVFNPGDRIEFEIYSNATGQVELLTEVYEIPQLRGA